MRRKEGRKEGMKEEKNKKSPLKRSTIQKIIS